METIKSVPQIVIHGGNDKTTLVTQSRAMVEAARKLGTEVKYIEVLGGTYDNLGPNRISQIFEFFASHAKKP
jgi:dipeptidyl aminopeptidase/acylaminoacyl peptidase